MKLNEYQMLSRRTRNQGLTTKEVLINCSLGLTGEAGEVADLVKKEVFHGHLPDDRKKILELGDLMFYISWMSDELGVTLEEVCTMNIEKLWKRYDKGFSEEASQNREEYKGVFLDEKI